MEPCVFLPVFKIVVYYGHELDADEVASHLRKTHWGIAHTEQGWTVQAIYEIPGVVRTQEGLAEFQMPSSVVDAIPKLEVPMKDGLKCYE
ncbi:hypothetical protein MKZ38_004592 [Zalerion maritima]|uniref:Uncharacterized protein n=1 Tax=Zalerion maritima TaxID=339359 RepID=A0AAD5WUF4_9PEZI|nr:hypothetical protein MKZ38_004592 [Zalerion maritima]